MGKLLIKIYKKPRLMLIDLLLLNLALFISFYLRLGNDWVEYIKSTYFVVVSLFGVVVLFFSDIYNKMWKYVNISDLEEIVKTAILINFLMVIYVYFFQVRFPRSIVILNGLLDVFFLGGIRYFFHLSHFYSPDVENKNSKRVLIIGAGDAAEMVIREMQKHPELEKEVVGLIDDDPNKVDLELHGKKVLGNRYDIPAIIKNYGIDEVLIAIPSANGKDIRDIYELSKRNGVKVQTLPGIYEILNGRIKLNQIREVRIEDLLGRDPVDLNVERISAYLKGKVVMVTGGGGSIGAELCRQIACFEPRILIIFDIYENNLYFLELELKNKYPNIKVAPIIGSIRDLDKLKYVYARYRPEVVFHAAAHKHVPLMEMNPEEAVKNNIFGTKNVAEVADEYGVDRFVLVSTDKAVNPTNIMGASKRVAEMIIEALNKESKTKYMAVRFGNVLGSEGSVIPLFQKQIANGGPVTVTHPDVTRYFMTIPEASQLVIQAGALGKGGEVFVLDMGEPVKIIDLAKDLIKLSGLKLNEDIDIEIIGLRPGEKLFEELLNDNEDNIATEHERIFITKLNSMDSVILKKYLEQLEEAIKENNTISLINNLIALIGTYQPKRKNLEDLYIYRDEKQFKEVASSNE